jgi:hypothetical protein
MSQIVKYPLDDIPGERLCCRRQHVADKLDLLLSQEYPSWIYSRAELIQKFFDKYHAVFFEPDPAPESEALRIRLTHPQKAIS